MVYEVGDEVRIKNPDIQAKDEMLSKETIALLEKLDFEGVVTQVQGKRFYVSFVHNQLGWVTQVFKADEIERIE